MKNFKPLLLLAGLYFTFVGAVFSQQLSNTYWKTYETGTNSFYLYMWFNNDSLYYSSDSLSYVPVSGYQESGNIFSIIDNVATGCSITDTGNYNFTILNDTLSFTPIQDFCTDRLDFFTGYYFVNLVTGMENEPPNPSLKIFPNPFGEQLTIESAEEIKKITIINFAGETVYSELPVGSTILNTTQFANGIYFYKIIYNKGYLRTGKLIKTQ